MKSLSNMLLCLLVLFTFDNKAYSISNSEIKKICQNKSRRSICIKDLKLKKLNLLQGSQIEIPVIPYKK